MSETVAARDFILEFLRRELVGPSPLPPDVQPNGEEILRPQDPPRQRYSAGVLFPIRSEVSSHDQTSEDETNNVDAGSPEAAPPLEHAVDAEPQGAGDVMADTDHDVNLTNQFLPSAMGLSALVDVPDCLQVKVRAATYRQGDSPGLDGNRSKGRPWLRQPIEQMIQLQDSELLGDGVRSLERSIIEVEGKPALTLHVISRPHPPSTPARLMTFTLINRLESRNQAPRNTNCFYQCEFAVSAVDNRSCFLGYPDRLHDANDEEELSLRLLYLDKRTFAIGHGCAADWNESSDGQSSSVWTEVLPIHEVKPVLHSEVEGLDLGMARFVRGDLQDTLDLCKGLSDAYEVWIADREQEVHDRRDLDPRLAKAARRNLQNCRECLRRMRDGVESLREDPGVFQAFRLMNRAMLMQHIHYELASLSPRRWVERSGRLELESVFQRPSYDDSTYGWRPFQLAFILMNLRALAEPGCDERQIVDVIWFPTGGGKTEAYLGLSAYTMFLQRIRNPEHAGTSILMRYTLRLLTTQQFQRASSLICACEVIRREDPTLGSQPFSIGLWVGGEVTPNDEQDAVSALRQLQKYQGTNKFILLSCPWCGAAMGPQRLGQSTRIKGYRILPRPQRVRHICEDSDCEFSSSPGLPIALTDEHIYESRPTLLIGTVDKFAMLAFRPNARTIFGLDAQSSPPELIIQDELHLISGPLGSMVGHYETAIDAMCVSAGGIGPKIVGSTATIARAESQVRALYGRDTLLFPPQALQAGDSFFAEERQDLEGRRYVGVFASALPSHVTAQVRTMGALLQAPKLFETINPEAIDPYWTMMGYFNSLRELGHAATLIRADIREYLNAMWDRLGLRLEATRKAGIDRRRFINRDVELTSRVQSGDIPSVLHQLFTAYAGPARVEAVDVCFATNMIQVGLDIPRLSLMTIIGQPKTTSEYIQASSRVGRNVDRPGIVVTNYNPSRSRDRSHYEHFRSYHETLYQHVEPTSVTPFAVPVRERALHAIIVILCRFWGDQRLRDRPDRPPDSQLVQRVKIAIQERVMAVDPEEWPETEAHIDEIFQKWSTAPRSMYGDFSPPTEELPMMYPAGGQLHPQWPDQPYPTPSSMRNVDASCSARPLSNGYGSGAPC